MQGYVSVCISFSEYDFEIGLNKYLLNTVWGMSWNTLNMILNLFAKTFVDLFQFRVTEVASARTYPCSLAPEGITLTS